MGRPGATPRHPALCDGCAEPIWFALVAHEPKPLRIPLRAEPSPAGTVAINPDRPWIHGRFLAGDETPDEAAGERRFVNHFDDCPKADQFRRKHAPRAPKPAPAAAEPTLF